MSWDEIQGHEKIVTSFRQAVARGRLASTFLFVGPEAIGKKKFAIQLAQSLLCDTNEETALESCGTCDACLQVKAGSHPDLLFLKKPAGKSRIPVELLIGERKNRMRQGLCYDITLRSFCGGRKIAIIDDADFLNQEGANCLLKTLEEPPLGSVIILISRNLQSQLPTIRSRSQIIRFSPLPTEIVSKLLIENQLVENQAEADQLASLGNGSLLQAKKLADEELRDFRSTLLGTLSRNDFASVAISKLTVEFVDQAGKDASVRRERLSDIVSFAREFFQYVLHCITGQNRQVDAVLETNAVMAMKFLGNRPEALICCLDRCLDAQAQIEVNANLTSLTDAWFDDLSSALRFGYIVKA
ncbi:MAG: DNA polymerase III subunit [Pirellulales bacterium]|jgi:DNA polymerase-3 subunit delta'